MTTKTKHKDNSYFKSVTEEGVTKDGKKFDDLIKEKPAFVKFFSKYCGHCTNMAPEWNKLNDDEEIADLGIYVIEVDVDGLDKITSICKDGANKGVPYITMVNKDGSVDDDKEYNGNRSKDDMKKFIMKNSKQKSHTSSMKTGTSSMKTGTTKTGGSIGKGIKIKGKKSVIKSKSSVKRIKRISMTRKKLKTKKIKNY